MSVTISANVLVRNEIKHVDAFVRNMIDACIDEVVFLTVEVLMELMNVYWSTK